MKPNVAEYSGENLTGNGMCNKGIPPIREVTLNSGHDVIPNGSDERVGYKLELICRSCGNQWLVIPGPDGEFFPGFWLCPRRCDL